MASSLETVELPDESSSLADYDTPPTFNGSIDTSDSENIESPMINGYNSDFDAATALNLTREEKTLDFGNPDELKSPSSVDTNGNILKPAGAESQQAQLNTSQKSLGYGHFAYRHGNKIKNTPENSFTSASSVSSTPASLECNNSYTISSGINWKMSSKIPLFKWSGSVPQYYKPLKVQRL